MTIRLRDKDGLMIGKASDKPILVTHVYTVEYPDVNKSSVAANDTVENIFAQVDGKGDRHVLFEDIIDYINYGSEVNQQDAFITTKNGKKIRMDKTKGW